MHPPAGAAEEKVKREASHEDKDAVDDENSKVHEKILVARPTELVRRPPSEPIVEERLGAVLAPEEEDDKQKVPLRARSLEKLEVGSAPTFPKARSSSLLASLSLPADLIVGDIFMAMSFSFFDVFSGASSLSMPCVFMRLQNATSSSP